MATPRSFWTSNVALALYSSFTVIVIGGLFIVSVIGGRELKMHRWKREEATVVNTFAMCRMLDGEQGRKKGSRYIETIRCEDLPSYLSQHGAEYRRLHPDVVPYISLGYASLGLDIKTIKLRDISRTQSLSAGQRFEILVHPRRPRSIDRLAVKGEFATYGGQLLLACVLIFIVFWVRLSLPYPERTSHQKLYRPQPTSTS